MPSAKQQPSNIKHGGGIRPNVWVLTFGPPCNIIYTIYSIYHYTYKEYCLYILQQQRMGTLYLPLVGLIEETLSLNCAATLVQPRGPVAVNSKPS